MAEVDDFWKVKIPPPLWFGAALVIGIVVNAWVIDFRAEAPIAVRIIGALALALTSLALAPNAIRRFHRAGENELPWTPTTKLVLSGPYKVTRNPMYVGLAFLQLAIGVALANGWVLVSVPIVLMAVYFTAVRFEEAYLEAEFGDSYRQYKATVRRWL